MRGRLGQFILLAVLTLGAGVYVLELSGRWDQTLIDTSDEVGLAVVVVCVGAATLIADACSDAIRLTRTPFAIPIRVARQPVFVHPRPDIGASCSPPPLGLRV